MDNAGNLGSWSAPQDFTVQPGTPPETSVSVNGNPVAAGAASEWVRSASVTFATSETATTYYNLGMPGRHTYAGSAFSITPDGEHPLTYWSELYGSTELAKTIKVRVDSTPPTTTASVASPYTGTAAITIGSSDGSGSGVVWTDYQIDSSALASGPVATTSAVGTHSIRHRAMDAAGNLSAWSAPQDFTVLVAPPKPTSLSAPSVSPSRPTHGKYATFTAYVSPGGAAVTGTSVLYLYRYETKTVHKKVRGRTRHVRVKYWRLRSSVAMTPDWSGRVSVRYKPRYSGKWKAQAVFYGSGTYSASTSGSRSFTVR
jgi:hypothetical protein